MTVNELRELLNTYAAQGYGDTRIYTQVSRNGNTYLREFSPEWCKAKETRQGIKRDKEGIKVIVG
jgi:hypothetical protein